MSEAAKVMQDVANRLFAAERNPDLSFRELQSEVRHAAENLQDVAASMVTEDPDDYWKGRYTRV